MKERIKNIGHLLRTIRKEDKSLFTILIFDILITTLARYPFILFPKYILDYLIEGRDFRLIVVLILSMVISDYVLSLLRDYISEIQKKHSKRLEFQLHQNITEKTMTMPYERLLNTDTYDRMYLASDIANGDNFMRLMDHMKNLFSNLLLLLSMIYLLARVDVILMLITFAVVIVNAVTDSKIQKRLYETTRQTSKTIRELEYIGRLGWHIDYAKEVRIYGIRKRIHEKYFEKNEYVLGKIFKNYREETKTKAINAFAGMIQIGAVYLLLGFKLLIQTITVGEFTLLMNAVNTFKSSLSGLLSNIIGVESHSKYFSSYIAYLEDDTEEAIDDSEKGRLLNRESKEIVFSHVSYQYPGGQDYALKDVNIVIHPGEKISLVGENGAGKTTFVLLLLKLLRPTEGKILLSGMDIQEISDEEYWKNFSAVFQDYRMYQFPIVENIAMAQEEPDREKIKRALRECGMEQVIENLEQGMDTVFGAEFEKNGAGFSGGQTQRLAMARAIFKDSDIIVLDEPTAALDAKAENEIFQMMNRLASYKTAFFISHRLYSTRFCDRIFFFEKGQIKEMGTHGELMKIGGGYYDMFQLQAQYYVEDER